MTERDRPATEDNIEITNAMIDAGVSAFIEWDDSEDWSAKNLVVDVFRRMAAAAPHYRDRGTG